MSSRENAQFYTPFDTWTGSTETWMALNDVNILDVTQDVIIYEYGFIRDARKLWGKISYDRHSCMVTAEELAGIAREVERIRGEVDYATER